jgi:undecaprenyl-diphosphatase
MLINLAYHITCLFCIFSPSISLFTFEEILKPDSTFCGSERHAADNALFDSVPEKVLQSHGAATMDSAVFKAIVLGLVQGLTEFLPVSSTAHLILVPWFFGWAGAVNSLIFDVALHAGTLVALIFCFYRDWIDMIMKDRRLLYLIIIASFPAGIAGILFSGLVEHTLRSPLIIACSLVTVGIIMLIAERYGKATKGLRKGGITLRDSLIIGVAQAVALIPGVSRSGITITAGLFRDLTRVSAARFSFLLSTPVILGATMLEGRKLMKTPSLLDLDMFTAGFVSAFVSGLVAIIFLLRFLNRHPLNLFVYYRFALAMVILIALSLSP